MGSTLATPELMGQAGNAPKLGRVAILTNFIAPYRKPMLLALARRCTKMKILVSTAMESNRAWDVDWTGLDVQLQKTITWKQRWRDSRVGGETVEVHVPVDTFAALSAFRPDVVISSEMGMRTAAAIVYRQTHRSTRLLVWADVAESTERQRSFGRNVLRHVIKSGPDGFIVNGESGARYLERLGISRQRIYKAPYATDVDRFGDSGEPRSNRTADRLLYVGQLIERKGLIPFLTALSRWAREHPDDAVDFTLAGDGILREKIASFPVPSNLRLQLLGNVPYEELPKVYREAGAFALPAFADTWALVVNEAMASGLPILGSRHAQAVEELVTEGRNGWLFDPEEEASLYAAIQRWRDTDAQQLAAMGAAAHETAMSLTPGHTADLLADAVLRCKH